jgi:hypothetical protein
MPTDIITEFNATLMQAKVDAVKVLARILHTETDRTKLASVATTLVRARTINPEPPRRRHTPAPVRSEPAAERPRATPHIEIPEVSCEPRLPALNTQSPARALILAAATPRSLNENRSSILAAAG